MFIANKSTIMPSVHRYNTVQVLRFVAALAVLTYHSTVYATNGLRRGSFIWDNGSHGVGLFFVISGFVMMLSSQKLLGVPSGWRIFMAQRVVRILPLYWLATSVKLVLMFRSAAAFSDGVDWMTVAKSYLFIPSLQADGNIRPILTVGWTLTFEMFFYAVLSIGMAVRINPLGWIATVFALMLVIARITPHHATAAWFLFDPIILEFLFGMVIGTLVLAGRYIRIEIAAIVLVVGLSLTFVWPRPVGTLPYAVSGGLVCALTVWAGASLEPLLKYRIPRVAILLGNASYAIYLFHPLCAIVAPSIIRRLPISSAEASVGLSVAIGLSVGAFVHVVMERRLSSLFGRLPVMRRLAWARPLTRA